MWGDGLYLLGNFGSLWSLRDQDQFSKSYTCTALGEKKQKCMKARGIEYGNAAINLKVSG